VRTSARRTAHGSRRPWGSGRPAGAQGTELHTRGSQGLDRPDDTGQTTPEPVERHHDYDVPSRAWSISAARLSRSSRAPERLSTKVRSTPAVVRASRCWSSDCRSVDIRT
jgi:hypothetical protein